MTRITESEGQIEPQELAKSIKSKLPQRYMLPSSKHCSIFRVPDVLFRHNVSASKPVLVSIGPHHHGKKRLTSYGST